MPFAFMTLGWLPAWTGASLPTPTEVVPVTETPSPGLDAQVDRWIDQVESTDDGTRSGVCRAAHQAMRALPLDDADTERFQVACPADFAVVAPPEFCLTGRCATL